jgi:methylglutaconyl-CoA hydratase
MLKLQGPLAVRLAKIAIDRGIEMEAASGMVLEEACYAQTLHTKDRIEALEAFAEKRKPHYRGE